MNREQDMNIIELAVTAELIDHRDTAESLPPEFVAALREFVAIVAAAAKAEEREACARVCDAQGSGRKALEHYAALTYSGAAHDCADAIRAKTNT